MIVPVAVVVVEHYTLESFGRDRQRRQVRYLAHMKGQASVDGYKRLGWELPRPGRRVYRRRGLTLTRLTPISAPVRTQKMS